MYDRFVNLLQQKEVTAYKVSKATGVGQSTFTDWKVGRSTPKQDKLQKIADYFGVPVSYFTDEDNIACNDNDLEVFNYFYLCNEKLLAPFFAKFIKLKRIELDYTERTVSVKAEIDLEKYINFETGEEQLTSAQLCSIMNFLEIDIRYICGSVSALLFTLKSITEHIEDKEQEENLKKLMMERYDLYELERMHRKKG